MSWFGVHWQDVLTALVLVVAAGYQVVRLCRIARGHRHGSGCASCPASAANPFAVHTAPRNGAAAARTARLRAPPRW